MTSDQWQELAANGLLIATAVSHALSKRKKQNRVLAERLADEVTQIREEVSTVKTVVGLHTMDLRENTKRVTILASDVEKLEKLLPELHNVMSKVVNFFERKKAESLEAKPVGDGMTVIKSKKEE